MTPKSKHTVPCITCGDEVRVLIFKRDIQRYQYQLQCIRCYERDPEKLMKRVEAAEKELSFLRELFEDGRRSVIPNVQGQPSSLDSLG